MSDDNNGPGRACGRGPRRLRVLVADDSATLRETLCDVLCCWGMHAEGVPDGEAARAALRRGDFDIALVDLVMPGADGIEVIREFETRAPTTRFYLMTAYEECERAREAETRYGIRVIAKPVDLALLLYRLRKAGISEPAEAQACEPQGYSAD